MSPTTNGPKSEDIFDISSPISHPPTNTTTTQSYNNDLNDLLGLDSFKTTTPNETNKTPVPATTASTNSNDMFDFFSQPSQKSEIPSQSPLKASSSSSLQVIAYEKNDVKIIFEPIPGANSTQGTKHFISMTASNLAVSDNVSDFLFGVAVPKSMQMVLSQPITSVIQPFDSMKQTININNPNKVGSLDYFNYMTIKVWGFKRIYFNFRIVSDFALKCPIKLGRIHSRTRRTFRVFPRIFSISSG